MSKGTGNAENEERIKLLPNWAQLLIAQLRNEVLYFKHQAGAVPVERAGRAYTQKPGAPVVLPFDPFSRVVFDLGPNRRMVIMLEGEGEVVDGEKAPMMLRISNGDGGGIWIEPAARNVIRIG